MEAPPTSPPLLSLDDDRWATLSHAYGPAVDTPNALRLVEAAGRPLFSPSLADMRANPTPWEQIVIAVLHQESVYTAAYAALPHLVRIAAGQPDLRGDVLSALGSALVGHRVSACPGDLREGWLWAQATARMWSPSRGLEGYAMAFQLRGFLALRHVSELVARIDQISTGEVEGLCPHCGAYALIDLPSVPLPEVVFSEPPLEWSADDTRSVARDVARWAGDETLALCIAGLDGAVTCSECDASFTPADAVAAEGRESGRG